MGDQVAHAYNLMQFEKLRYVAPHSGVKYRQLHCLFLWAR